MTGRALHADGDPGMRIAPAADLVLWLANTVSMLLAVTDLTNLLTLHHVNLPDVGQLGYLRLA